MQAAPRGKPQQEGLVVRVDRSGWLRPASDYSLPARAHFPVGRIKPRCFHPQSWADCQEIEGAGIHQGSPGATVLFAAERFDDIAQIIKPRKRRRLSEQQRAAAQKVPGRQGRTGPERSTSALSDGVSTGVKHYGLD